MCGCRSTSLFDGLIERGTDSETSTELNHSRVKFSTNKRDFIILQLLL